MAIYYLTVQTLACFIAKVENQIDRKFKKKLKIDCGCDTCLLNSNSYVKEMNN